MTRQISFGIRCIVLVLGIFLLGLGISMMIRAGLGVSPWTVFHMGISNMSSFSVGRITQLVGLVLVVTGSVLLKQRPGIGTIVNMFFVGFVVDFLLDGQILPYPAGLLSQVMLLVLGVVTSGVGTGMYIAAKFGAGPRDSVMLGIARLSNRPVGKVRSLIDITVLLLGFLLGGPVGFGTIVGVGVGPIVQFSLKTTERLMEVVFIVPERGGKVLGK